MKYVIEEVKTGKSRYFKKVIKDSSNRIIKTMNIIYTILSTEINGVDYYILYDEEMHIVEPVYRYINIRLLNYSSNTKFNYIKAIKQLYEFAAICEKPVKELNYDDLNRFQYFLKGFEPGNPMNSIYMYTGKCIKDVYKYTTICKNFMKYSKYKNYELLEVTMSHTGKISSQKSYDCPRFISYYEMEGLLSYIERACKDDKENMLKYKSIFMLMEYSGLRIGEVLGLTIEDLKTTFDEEGNTIYYARIRNRLSDSKFQQAKTCMTVRCRKDYKTSEYNTRKVGWQDVLLNEETYICITDYFDLMDNRLRKKNKTPTKADCVESSGANYYIFTNRKNTNPQSIHSLSIFTKEAFKACDIAIDEGVRQNNLFHRFRHGYAMHLLYELHLPDTIVIEYMRHSSTRSLEKYNNPTNAQLSQLLTEMEEENEIDFTNVFEE